jgi:glycosyltransferase involved in cell wall biosynthesis
MEFMSQGVPVVISRTKIDSYYFDDSVVEFFTSGDIHSLTDSMMNVIEDKARREELIRNGYEYVSRNSWASRERDYYDLVDSLSVEVFEESTQTPVPS